MRSINISMSRLLWGQERREQTDGCPTFNRIDIEDLLYKCYCLQMSNVIYLFRSQRRQKMEIGKKQVFSCLVHHLCVV